MSEARSVQSRPVAMGQNGVASTPHALASEAAIEAMKRGGNAVDAAVTAAAVCAVVQPFSSGIGGLGWATVHDAASGSVEVLEFHGCVPGDTHAGLFTSGADGLIDWQELEARGRGLLGSLVPGALAGWDELLRKKGTLSLGEALASAIRLADDGFPVSTLLHETIAEAAPRLAPWAASARLFLKDGRALPAGAMLRQPALAATLGRIASDGLGAFYDGPIGRGLVRFHAANGGALSARDLADYRPSWREPLTGTYRGVAVKAGPAPFGDLSFLQGLGILERFSRYGGPFDPDYVHASLESAKLVRADRRAYLGDTGAGPDAFAHLLSPAYLDAQAARIGATAHRGNPEPPGPPHTITLAVIDKAGNAVHLMQTIGYPFGTGAMDDETGIIPNSSLYFADADPKLPNGVGPGKRLEQNPAVMMAFNEGRLAFIVGSPGGKTRVETVRQMLVNIVDFGMNIQRAVDAPRFLSAPDGITAELEEGMARFAPDLAGQLEARGHRVAIVPRRFGTGQAVMIDAATGMRMGGADWRQESIALAY